MPRFCLSYTFAFMQRLSLLVVVFLFITCNYTGKSLYVPDHPYLKPDTIQRFRIGDRFILSLGKNSCCMYCWNQEGSLQRELPVSPILKHIETIEDPADPDCAGCSDFYYHVYECKAAGADTLRYVVIPMGEVGEASSCTELQIKRLDSSHYRNYFISVETR